MNEDVPHILDIWTKVFSSCNNKSELAGTKKDYSQYRKAL